VETEQGLDLIAVKFRTYASTASMGSNLKSENLSDFRLSVFSNFRTCSNKYRSLADATPSSFVCVKGEVSGNMTTSLPGSSKAWT
jgi:hypothetical protein